MVLESASLHGSGDAKRCSRELRKYFHDDVLVTNRFTLREFPKGSGHQYYILEGPGIGSWGMLGDAGKFSTSMLQTLWAYAHYSGDWDLIKERWELIRKLFAHHPKRAGRIWP